MNKAGNRVKLSCLIQSACLCVSTPFQYLKNLLSLYLPVDEAEHNLYAFLSELSDFSSVGSAIKKHSLKAKLETEDEETEINLTALVLTEI